MVNYNSNYTRETMKPVAGEVRVDYDLTLFVVYDHRQNSNLDKIAKNLFGDLLQEIQNVFIQLS